MLRKLLGWRNNKSREEQVSISDDPIGDFYRREKQIREAGSVDGEHFTSYVEQIKQLKREKRYQEAIELLLRIIDATESQSKVDGLGVVPWYYEQLAIIYRKEKRFSDEVAILERYEAQPKGPGAKRKVLADRLLKARELVSQ